jgi:hypothetical protein
MQIDNLLCDRILRHQPIDRHRTLLADAMGAIGPLIFYCRISTGIHMNHIIRRHQVQARPPDFSAIVQVSCIT